MSLGDKLRSVSELTRRPAAYLGGKWDRLAPREQRMASALGGVVVVIVVLVAVFYVLGKIGTLEESTTDARDALAAIAKHRNEYLEAKSRSTAQEAKVGNGPPQLMADIEAAAREIGLQIPETNELQPTASGKRYLEHDLELQLRGVELQPLVDFMRKVETGPRLIFFSRISLDRHSDPDKLNAKLTATAFERVQEDKIKKKPETPAKKESVE